MFCQLGNFLPAFLVSQEEAEPVGLTLMGIKKGLR